MQRLGTTFSLQQDGALKSHAKAMTLLVLGVLRDGHTAILNCRMDDHGFALILSCHCCHAFCAENGEAAGLVTGEVQCIDPYRVAAAFLRRGC